jgi:hypothetical protein
LVGSIVSGYVYLTWTDNSNSETGFKVERSPNGSNGWTSVVTQSADTRGPGITPP